MIEVKIPDSVTDPLEVMRRLRDAGIPVMSRPRFSPYGKYDPVLIVERGRLEWLDDKLEYVRVIRWRE